MLKISYIFYNDVTLALCILDRQCNTANIVHLWPSPKITQSFLFYAPKCFIERKQ